MKILFADDDITSRMLLQAVVSKWGYQVVEACDGLEAWEKLQEKETPRLVILDWMMPEMTGLELCRKLREQEWSQSFYIILLTGRGQHQDIVHGLDAGADDYIAKPYNHEELRSRLNVGRRILALQEALIHAVDHDYLTGAFSRRAVLHALEREIARTQRQGSLLAVGMMDIDYFKQVNDTHGHVIGDEVLQGIVKKMQSRLRKYDYLGRYGGEEFLVITSGLCEQVDFSFFERFRQEIADNPIPTSVGPIPITVSIGVAIGGSFSTVDGILGEADTALYRAKKAGRNQVFPRPIDLNRLRLAD